MRIRLLLATVSLLACCGGPDADVFWPVHDARGMQPGALLDGTLEVSDGCVYLRADHGGRWLGIWPEGLRPELTGGRLRIVDELGGVVAIEGERLRAGGGERHPSGMGGRTAFEAWAEDFIGEAIPPRCGTRVWQVSGIDDA